MKKWPSTKIDDICIRIAMGPFGSNIKVDNFVPSGVPVLNGSNLIGFKLKEDSFNYVTESKADELKNSLAYKGDIVVTHRGTLGQIIYIPSESKYDKYVISQSQFLLRVNPDKADSRFITYFFHSAYGQYLLLSNASQVGVPALARPTSTFKSLEIPLPPLPIQKKIADFLCLVDEKIDINTQINQNLEAQAQAIFKSWFVDFEPFNGGKFVDSEFGPIPECFKICNNGELPIVVTDYVANGSFASLKANVKLYQEQEFAYFVRNTDLKTGTFEVFVDKHSYDFLSKTRLFGGEIIISNVGDVGSVFLCPVLDKPMTLGNNIIMIKPEIIVLKYYLFIWFKWFAGQGLIQGIKSGSAQPKFNKTDFKALPLALPPELKLQEFHSIVSPIFKKMEALHKESMHLTKLKDTLLPKLMSGEIDVSNIEI